jgi:periplasmic protein TonB
MVKENQTGKVKPMFLKATVASLGLHVLSAVLLILCFRANSLVHLPQSIITVDIRTLETAVKPEAKPSWRSEPVRDEKLKSSLPRPVYSHQEPSRLPKTQLKKEPLLVQYATAPAETVPASAPVQSGSEYPARTLSPANRYVGTLKPADIDSTGKENSLRLADKGGINAENAYLSVLKEIIERNREYPLMARRGQMEGTVHIRCTISRNGELMEVNISRSSGYNILDNAAKRAVISAGRFPVVPTQIRGDPYRFVSPITFRLSEE